MKSVMLSIQPKWCELIVNGSKTIEIRKTRPKIDTPFKCYIYCALSGINEIQAEQYMKEKWSYKKGKVIGEFVCDEIEQFTIGSLKCDDIQKLSKVNYEEIIKYFYKDKEINGNIVKQGYAWHISELQIYDKPKDLSEFNLNRGFQSWGYVESEVENG